MSGFEADSIQAGAMADALADGSWKRWTQEQADEVAAQLDSMRAYVNGGRETGPVVDAIRAALDAAVCDDTSEVLPPGTLARLLAVAELDRDTPRLFVSACVRGALARLAAWCDGREASCDRLAARHATLAKHPSTRERSMDKHKFSVSRATVYARCAKEARRLAGAPLPRVVR